jgi:hypothetical protein
MEDFAYVVDTSDICDRIVDYVYGYLEEASARDGDTIDVGIATDGQGEAAERIKSDVIEALATILDEMGEEIEGEPEPVSEPILVVDKQPSNDADEEKSNNPGLANILGSD